MEDGQDAITRKRWRGSYCLTAYAWSSVAPIRVTRTGVS